MRSLCRIGLTGLALAALVLPLRGQSNISQQLADLTQDVAALNRQVGQMQLRLEAQQRQNTALRESLDRVVKQQNDLVSAYNSSLQTTQKQVAALRAEFKAADAAQKEAVIAEVSRQIDGLAAQTQQALDQLAEAIGSMPGELQPQVEFSEDYPENGVLYTVKRGDTLSGIARRLDSTVKDIQNANKIVDPARDLRVGDVIFVPQGSQ